MKLGDNYKIESDELNITIYEKRFSKKSGEEYWKTIGYFATVKNALKYAVDLEVSKTELKDLQIVVKKQDELYALIKSLNIPQKC